jgi:hypothetical protein
MSHQPIVFETGIQTMSGQLDLVDLVECVGRHGGGGHRLALARK